MSRFESRPELVPKLDMAGKACTAQGVKPKSRRAHCGRRKVGRMCTSPVEYLLSPTGCRAVHRSRARTHASWRRSLSQRARCDTSSRVVLYNISGGEARGEIAESSQSILAGHTQIAIRPCSISPSALRAMMRTICFTSVSGGELAESRRRALSAIAETSQSALAGHTKTARRNCRV